ncbi:MAG: FAD-dependent thymidylate synthase [Candidatus Hydrogenedentota bacterium]|nr:MAG: FAD-dependent thymidylate synthase [Candidatus Hydrogenedentota bacterium]
MTFSLDEKNSARNQRLTFRLPVEVRLLHASPRPLDNAVAAAMTCYSDTLLTADDLTEDQPVRRRREVVAKRTFEAGHNTVQQHNTFQFAITGISRYAVWSFLHNHPFYNSEQVSQRYVPVNTERVVVPPLSPEGRKIFEEAVRDAAGTYRLLGDLLYPTAERFYRELFPGRSRALDSPPDEKGRGRRWRREIHKRVLEVARYVLPIAVEAHLHHTISGLTLHRYRRLMTQVSCPEEIRSLVQGMIEEVERHDPSFFLVRHDPLPLEQTPEYRLLLRFSSERHPFGTADDWIRDFDSMLGRYRSLLISPTKSPLSLITNAVRSVLALDSEQLDEELAMRWAVDPAVNPNLTDSLGLAHHDPFSRALMHAHFTFLKKLSLTADAQDQRHRCVPGTRPLLQRHFRPHRPDFIVPVLIKKCPEAEEVYRNFMRRLWNSAGRLLDLDEPLSSVLYLLPNAFPVRFCESGDLLSLRHKWSLRLCLNAQEEIWYASRDEVEQVGQLVPEIRPYLLPPCGIRFRANIAPFCPEGSGYCGIPLWRRELQETERIL